jgi:CubicO group peptidase (beta-lactamase class C family)
MRFLLALTFATSLGATTATAQSLDTRAVDRLMTATLQQWQIPGASIAIIQNDRVVYLKGYGTKDGTQPVTPDTLFQIASTSKAFTSTALAMLASDGKLSFDDPVRKHLPYFRIADTCADSQVTIRDIVSHRTGLPRRDELWDDTPLTREDVVRRMGMLALQRPFRASYGYHNINFIAAGEAVTRTSGMSWDDFVRTRIFQPLGMKNTVINGRGVECVDGSRDRLLVGREESAHRSADADRHDDHRRGRRHQILRPRHGELDPLPPRQRYVRRQAADEAGTARRDEDSAHDHPPRRRDAT